MTAPNDAPVRLMEQEMHEIRHRHMAYVAGADDRFVRWAASDMERLLGEHVPALTRALAEARELIQEKLLGSHGMPGQWRRDARRWLAAHEQETTP